jgi:adenylate cyclase
VIEAPHHLIEISHRPRVLAFVFAFVIVISPVVERPLSVTRGLFGLFLLFYPFLVNWLTTNLGNSGKRAECAMLFDGCMVGILIVVVQFSLLPSVVFLTLLIISSMSLNGPGFLFRVLFLLLATAFVFSRLGNVLLNVPGTVLLPGQFERVSVMELTSALCLLVYVGFMAWLVFLETRRLNHVQRHESRLRGHVEALFCQLKPYLAPQVLNRPSVTKARKRLTVFFSDIEGFTKLMDEGDETLVARVLGEYLDEMTRIASVHRGTVDKFMGDGVMIFFGDPTSRGATEDAFECVAMALEMRRAVSRLTSRWQQFTRGSPIHIRIGIHTGYCLVGSFGSGERLEYTTLGSAVNLASRLESAAGPDEILISRDTWNLVKPWIHATSLGDISVKGITDPVSVFRVLGASGGNARYRQGNVKLLESPVQMTR